MWSRGHVLLWWKRFNECEMPQFCIPSKGPAGKDGKDCPSFCPAKCGPEDMQCPGGKDWNECEMPEFCIPNKGPLGKDGNECPSFCPAKCGPEETVCAKGPNE